MSALSVSKRNPDNHVVLVVTSAARTASGQVTTEQHSLRRQSYREATTATAAAVRGLRAG